MNHFLLLASYKNFYMEDYTTVTVNRKVFSAKKRDGKGMPATKRTPPQKESVAKR